MIMGYLLYSKGFLQRLLGLVTLEIDIFWQLLECDACSRQC